MASNGLKNVLIEDLQLFETQIHAGDYSLEPWLDYLDSMDTKSITRVILVYTFELTLAQQFDNRQIKQQMYEYLKKILISPKIKPALDEILSKMNPEDAEMAGMFCSKVLKTKGGQRGGNPAYQGLALAGIVVGVSYTGYTLVNAFSDYMFPKKIAAEPQTNAADVAKVLADQLDAARERGANDAYRRGLAEAGQQAAENERIGQQDVQIRAIEGAVAGEMGRLQFARQLLEDISKDKNEIRNVAKEMCIGLLGKAWAECFTSIKDAMSDPNNQEKLIDMVQKLAVAAPAISSILGMPGNQQMLGNVEELLVVPQNQRLPPTPNFAGRQLPFVPGPPGGIARGFVPVQPVFPAMVGLQGIGRGGKLYSKRYRKSSAKKNKKTKKHRK